MKTLFLGIIILALFNPVVPAQSDGPIVLDVSKADSSVDPTTVTYAGDDKNVFGQPMHVLVPSQFATDSGLIAVARRLAKDNSKYPFVQTPVQIYSDNDSDRELAEYWHTKTVHDLRIVGSDRFVRKIVEFPKGETSVKPTAKQMRAVEAEAKKAAAEVAAKFANSTAAGVTLANYNRLKNGMSYSEAVKVLGKDGVELSSSDMGGVHTVMYQWQSDGIGNMNAMFQRGRLIQKAQFGLE